MDGTMVFSSFLSGILLIYSGKQYGGVDNNNFTIQKSRDCL